MRFSSPLVFGTLVKRYKRFLADIRMSDGSIVTVHCPNSGAMAGLLAEGNRVGLSRSTNPNRKLPFTWEIVEADMGGVRQWVGVHAARANAIFRDALESGAVPAFSGYKHIRPEFPYGLGSRVDFLLTAPDKPEAYVEIKNCHMMRASGLAEFPDSVSTRGAKHMRELAAVAAGGKRAAVVYIVQMSAEGFRVAADMDPAYDAEFRGAVAGGVEAYAFTCRVSPDDISVEKGIPVLLR
ncbi:MAG: DNA/RNA nuclease SfsA [Methylobacteriaceae bacterium]|jgi:sugar fermentation stimulation protein A|nr:DNA/RNA nuclease SfsA [Methylobacteriaceae bacterium]